jgi:hypothetical protein
MIARAGSGWQTVLADLSLILFMVMAAAVSEVPAEPAAQAIAPHSQVLPALGEPVALWRAGPDAPPLREWLAAAGADPQLRLTIVAPAREAATAQALAAEAGRPARIVLEAEARGPVLAALTYDQAAPLAQGLQSGAANQPPSEAP